MFIELEQATLRGGDCSAASSSTDGRLGVFEFNDPCGKSRIKACGGKLYMISYHR